MKSERLYDELKQLAEKLGIEVLEQNLKKSGVRVKSGFCIVKQRRLYVMDKHQPIGKKVMLLAECLAGFDHQHLFVVPAVRDVLMRFEKSQQPEKTSGQNREPLSVEGVESKASAPESTRST